MAETIKGLNVVIGAETTGLNKALADVNKSSRDVQSELRQVERLLKFNPRDTELLAQKQKLLGDQVGTTREKLDRLRDAQKQIGEQFKKGDITEGQYRAFQREIVETESKLKNYEKQLQEVTKSKDQFKQRLTDLGNKLQSFGDKASKVGQNLSMKVTAPIAGIGAIAFKMAADVEDAMGATDQIFGRASNVMKSWANDLEAYYGIAKGEALEYGNMMGSMLQNIGKLSEKEAAQQTQKLIKLAGDLAAMYGGTTADAIRALTGALKGNNTMLDNYGMAVNDAMLKTKAYEMGLYSGTGQMELATKQAATLALIMEQSGAAQGQAAREAEGASGLMRALGTELKNLGTSIDEIILPAITPLISRLSDMVKNLRELDPATKKAVVLIAGAAAALGPLLIMLGKTASAMKILLPAIAGIGAPATIAIAAIGSLAAAFGWLAGAEDRAIRKNQEAIKSQEAQVNSATDLIAEYKQLSEKTNQTNEEKERLIELSNTIAEVIPGAVSAYDAEGNALIDLNLALVQTVNLKREEMALRAKDLDALIKQAEKRQEIAENEKKRLDERWAEMNKRWEDWNQYPEQERLNELTAEYQEEIAKVTAEINKSTRELTDLRTEQTTIAKLTEELTVDYVAGEIEKRNAAKATTKVVVDEEAAQSAAAAKEAEKREQLEAQWTKKRFQQYASRKDVLLAEMKEEIEKAQAVGAETTNIISYYSHEIAKIDAEERQKRTEEDKKWFEEQLKIKEEQGRKRTEYEKRWNDQLLQENERYRIERAQSTEEEYALRLEQLNRQKDTELEAADDLGAERQTILDYYALKEKELLDWKEEAYRKSAQVSADAFIGFVDVVGSGSKTLGEAIKDMVISVISNLQKKILAEAMAAEAIAWAWSLQTFGASLAHLGTVAGKVLPSIGTLEALKAGVRSLAEGGKATAPTLAVVGDNPRYDEAVMPLSPQVFAEIGKGIAASLPQNRGGEGVTVNLYVGTMIGDERGMKKLAQKVFSYEYSIKQRTGEVGA